MSTYIAQTAVLNDANPGPFTIPAAKPKAIQVLARAGSAVVTTGPLATGLGGGTFTVKQGESWQWSVDDVIDSVEPATIAAAEPGSEIQIMWLRF